jgi:hypothetical protein
MLHGSYYGPFARILLAVVSVREKKFEDARQLLSRLVGEYPENPLLRGGQAPEPCAPDLPSSI